MEIYKMLKDLHNYYISFIIVLVFIFLYNNNIIVGINVNKPHIKYPIFAPMLSITAPANEFPIGPVGKLFSFGKK
jgi:hypothetical protein